MVLNWIYVIVSMVALMVALWKDDKAQSVILSVVSMMRSATVCSLVGVLGYLLYLGQFVDYYDWASSLSVHDLNTQLKLLFLLMWSSFSIFGAIIACSRVSMLCMNWVKVLVIGLSLGIIYCAQQFFLDFTVKVLILTVASDKQRLIENIYGGMTTNYLYFVGMVVGWYVRNSAISVSFLAHVMKQAK